MKSLALLITLLAGCTDTTPPPCDYATPGIALEYRDPSTGQCESFSSPCEQACGPCDDLATEPPPNWPQCYGTCESLGETACLATPSCHAAYQDDSASKPVFWGCWDPPPSGAVEGSCTGLDAATCVAHDNCTSLYTGPVNQPPNFVPSFESCQPEVAQAACATLTTEAACLARNDCDAVYNGMDCTCDSSGCTCATETFASCK